MFYGLLGCVLVGREFPVAEELWDLCLMIWLLGICCSFGRRVLKMEKVELLMYWLYSSLTLSCGAGW